METETFGGRWRVVKTLGRGGQGVVYEVIDGQDGQPPSVLAAQISQAVKQLSAVVQTPEHNAHYTDSLVNAIRQINAADDAPRGALKKLHPPEEAVNARTAEQRMRHELEVLGATSHPALIRVLHANADERWFVTEYHPGGTLSGHLDKFRGRALDALVEFRPVVDAVRQLHVAGIVHRDIKPENVFIASDGRLVLGDCGIAFKIGNAERLTEMFENVGSRDWMPGWAHGKRLDGVAPTFDVFSLGKLLWAMVSGVPRLQLWYYNKPQFNLTQMFPGDDAVARVHDLLSNAIVEDEAACLPDASHLLRAVDRAITSIKGGHRLTAKSLLRGCVFCGQGSYVTLFDQDGTTPEPTPLGFHVGPWSRLRMLACSYCGHVQMFHSAKGRKPPAWEGVPD